MTRGKSDDVERRSEVERDDASSAAVAAGADGPSAPKRHTEAKQGSGGRAAALPKPHGRADADADGDGGGTGVGGTLGPANCMAGPQLDARDRSASRASVRGRDRFTSSAAKRLAYGAGHGAAGPTARSPALERYLVALSCAGAVLGPRSRYIPVGVRREVWRRDQGCCSYVDRHSGRRCRSRYRLEIDHIVPFALGGAAELSNLRLLCEVRDYAKRLRETGASNGFHAV